MTDPMRPTGWKLCTLTVWYLTRFSRKPPTKEPTMPSRMVPRTPMLSRPGSSRRAMAPMIRPTMHSQMMKMTMPVRIPPPRVLCPGTGEFALQRGPEPGSDPRAGPDPLAKPLGLGGYRGRGFGPGVLEQPDRDLPVLALCPAAHDPAVPPSRRADVARPVEQGRGVLAHVPGSLAPAHGGGVQRGQQRRPGLGGGGRGLVAGQQYAGRAAEVHLGEVQRAHRLPDLACGPARPPLQVGQRGRAERGQPPPGQFGPGGRSPP